MSVEEFMTSIRREGLPHNPPFLLKANHSHEGEGLFLITDSDTLSSTLGVLAGWERTGQSGFISQVFIPPGGNVLRAVVLGSRIITYWKRPALDGSVISSISKTAVVDENWRKDLQEKGRLQAEVFTQKTGINVAALDYVFPMNDSRGEPLLLEVNYYFGRRGLGGSLNYYRLLFDALQEWLRKKGFDPSLVRLS